MNFKLKRIFAKLGKLEPYYFYIFLIVNLIPVLTFKLFPTVDGPAHLYNSRLIIELLANDKSSLNDFFIFNNIIPPNCTGHLFLSIFQLIFPGFIAEKIVLLMYLIGLPLGMRYLFNILSIRSKFLLYLIFPFTYSFFFFYGFYNFNLGCVFLLFGISFWIKYKDNINLKRLSILCLFSTLICVSHLFVFAVFLLVIFLLNLNYFPFKTIKTKPVLINQINYLIKQFVALLIGIIIMVKYMIISPASSSTSEYLSILEIFKSIIRIDPVIGIAYGRTAIYTQWLFFTLLSLILFQIIAICVKYKRIKSFSIKNRFWLIISLLTFALIFIIPDSKGIATGYITFRYIFFFYIFLIIYLSLLKTPLWLKIIVFTIVNFANTSILINNYRSIKDGCRVAQEIIKTSDDIEPNSIVFPIIKSDIQIYGHISNYLGCDKPMVILDNYEATLTHFPLLWNCQKIPLMTICNIDIGEVYKGCSNPQNTNTRAINYIFVLYDEKQNKETIDSLINNICSDYHLVHSGLDGTIQLYKKNEPQ